MNLDVGALEKEKSITLEIFIINAPGVPLKVADVNGHVHFDASPGEAVVLPSLRINGAAIPALGPHLVKSQHKVATRIQEIMLEKIQRQKPVHLSLVDLNVTISAVDGKQKGPLPLWDGISYVQINGHTVIGQAVHARISIQ